MASKDDKMEKFGLVIDALEKAPATGDGKPATMPCPVCGGTLRYIKGTHRGRPMIRASCGTPDCVRMMT